MSVAVQSKVYCWACKSEVDEGALEESILPGLCESCRLRSTAASAALEEASSGRFSPSYFDQPDVDPLAWKRFKSCNRCGVVGQCFGWTHWRRSQDECDGEVGCDVEGDGYLFCRNCSNVTCDPWGHSEVPASELHLPGTQEMVRNIKPVKALSTLYLLAALIVILVAMSFAV